MNPKISEYSQLFGHFDFNATPLVPPGTKVIIHTEPAKQASWVMHRKESWYVGPSVSHYCCIRCFLPKTRAEINSDTVVFMPKQINFPEVTVDNFIKQSLEDLITLLTYPPPPSIPTLQAGDPTRNVETPGSTTEYVSYRTIYI